MLLKCVCERERERERERDPCFRIHYTHTHTHPQTHARVCDGCSLPCSRLASITRGSGRIGSQTLDPSKGGVYDLLLVRVLSTTDVEVLLQQCAEAAIFSWNELSKHTPRPYFVKFFVRRCGQHFFLYTKQATVLVLSCLLAPLDTHTTTPHTHTHTHHFSLSIFDPLFEFVDSSITVHVCASPLPNTVRVQNLATYLLLLVIHTFPDKISHRERVFAALHLINAAGPFASAFHKVWCFALVRCLLFCCLLFLAAHKEPISSILAPVSMNDVHLPHPPAYRAACCDWPTRSGSACTS